MSKPRILFVTGKWCNYNPESGPSTAQQNYYGSLAQSGAADFDCFFIDEHLLQNPGPYDEALIEHCRRTSPDIVYATLTRGVDFYPAPDVFAAIRKASGARIVLMFPDTFGPGSAGRCEKYSPAADLILLQDSYTDVLSNIADGAKYLPVWTPQDPNLFFDPGAPRDINISFLGSIARYTDRKIGIGMLAEAGIDIFHRGGQDEDPISLDDYADLMRRSKIALNFSRPVFDEPGHQCKGRVFEATLSGAMLLEQANDETERWMTAGKHYIAFEDERDLVEKAGYYLEHEDERQAIAEAGHKHAAAYYSAEKYWRAVLDRAHPNAQEAAQ
ncbi:MAG: glycosyltransferase family 1 protein [Rhodospirillales bacterium]|nr:glycosyltransferase family 1 protein [Rhodospirillales bacterium]